MEGGSAGGSHSCLGSVVRGHDSSMSYLWQRQRWCLRSGLNASCHSGVQSGHANVVCNDSYGGHRGRATAATRTTADMAMAGRLGKGGSFVVVDDVNGFEGGFDLQEVC